ncbi:MAG: glycyl radical protein [Candidatus Abyssubacteria bacterium]
MLIRDTGGAMELRDEASERIKRLRRRYMEEPVWISVERARYYTESWRETEGSGMSLGVRVALAMKHVFEKMTHCVDPDDRIAGTWTEYFLGTPIDVERGLFNNVLRIELDKGSMLAHQIKSNARFLSYMVRKYGPLEFYRNIKRTREVGAAMPSIGLKTMSERKINPYAIKPENKRILRNEVLPHWEGETMAEVVAREMERSGLFGGDLRDFAAALPATTSKMYTFLSPGAVLGTYQGHVVLDYERAVVRGLLTMKKEVQQRVESSDSLTRRERDFLQSVEIALDGIIIYARRLAEKVKEELDKAADPERKAVLSRMLECCQRVPLEPSESFREAVQSFWTVKVATELANITNVHSAGRIDQIFYPYYTRDIERGRITRDEARELLEELLLKIMTQNVRPESNFIGDFYQRYEGSAPVTLGGMTRDGADATNELTYILLEAAERSKSAVNVVVRFHESTPESLSMKVADVLYHGTSSVSLMNDEVCIEAMKRRGFSEEDARDYAITGCVDLLAPGKTGGIGFAAILLSRVLDMTLRNGDSQTLVGLIPNAGVKTGDPDSFSSFDQLLDAFIAQASHVIKTIADGSNLRDRLFAEMQPAPYMSAFMQGCLEKKKDVTEGGAVYDLSGILFMNSIANVVDSLYVMKRLIFEEKRLTFKELLEAIDHNFVGFEHVHRMIKGVEGKWGNGNPESDKLAREVTTRLFEETYRHESFKGGPFVPFVNSMTSHTYDGRISIATPDGRKAATPFAASCNPYNVDTCGVTGVLRSVAALDFTHIFGCAVNIRLHPSAIGKSEEARRKWAALVKTYFRMGGMQLQPTVASTEVLRAAQKDPDSYRSLIVKVGGYSTYFVDLGREIQNEIISRSEHRVGV